MVTSYAFKIYNSMPPHTITPSDNFHFLHVLQHINLHNTANEKTVMRFVFVSCAQTKMKRTRTQCKLLSVSDLAVGPRLLTEPKPQTVDIGMDAAFTCSWTGNPPLTLAWTKQGSSVVC